MNIKPITTTLFLFLIASPAFAAMQYPTIGGITISETTTAAEYIVYFFNLAIAMGAFAAVIMMIMAGIEWVTAAGNPSKIESAKGKIANTLFGVAVLVGCYLILNTINNQLLSIKIDDLKCEHGITVSVRQASDNKIKQECIDSSQTNIEDTIVSTLSWNFPEDYLLRVYLYSEPEYKGTITQIDCRTGSCNGNISGAKSIYFLLNNAGIYLYDDNSYTPRVKSYPLFTSTSIPDLSKTNSFDNFIRSIEIINPDQDKQQLQYSAIIFKDQNYQGRCAFVGQSVSDMDAGYSGYYTDAVGDDEISSIIVAKSNLNEEAISQKRGEIILYSKVNCGKSDTDPTKQIKACHIPITSVASGQVDISESCYGSAETAFKEGDEVMSFEITGAAGLILSTSKKQAGNEQTYCMYFNKESLGGGTCLSSILDTHIFTVGGTTPQSYIIVPEN